MEVNIVCLVLSPRWTMREVANVASAPAFAASSMAWMSVAAWLAALAKRGGTLPRNQDVPAKAKVRLSELERWSDNWATLPLLIIS